MALDIPLLERTFDQVRPSAAEFAADFYADLFARFPETKAYFANSDMKAQQKKLMDSLVLVIENLENGDLLANALRNLGDRHARLGIEPRHYDLVAQSLLATLEKHLGAAWTPAARQAWVDAYGAIAGLMTRAA